MATGPCWCIAGEQRFSGHGRAQMVLTYSRLVLCPHSNGCGRSGTYVCLDANLQLAEDDGVVDIFNYAKSLRKARMNMIENLEQYKFVYETIEEWHVCGKTWFHVSEISQQMKPKSTKNKVTNQNEYQREFEVCGIVNENLV